MRSIRLRVSGAVAVGCAALLAAACGASRAAAQDSVPHVEACAHNAWGFLVFNKHRFGTVNMCSEPISIWFLLKSGKIIHADIEPKAVFDTGVSGSRFPDWAAAVCPHGTTPNPVVTLANWNPILKSQYVCAPVK